MDENKSLTKEEIEDSFESIYKNIGIHPNDILDFLIVRAENREKQEKGE